LPARSWERSAPGSACCSASRAATRKPSVSRAGSPGCGSSRTLRAASTGACSTGGAALVVSQFTLLADSKSQKGTRPDFSAAAPKEQAEPLYEEFCQALRDLGVHVETGVFGARMALELVNDGPVTIILDA